MKKRLIALAAGAAMVAGGAVVAIPGGSAHGFNLKQCIQIDKAGHDAILIQGTPNSETLGAREGQFIRAFAAANC